MNQAYLIQGSHSLMILILLKLLINSKNLKIIIFGLNL